MKKLKMFLFFFFALLLLPAAIVLGQDEIPTIPDWQYLYDNFGTLMFSYLGIAAIASFVGEAIIRIIKATKKVVKVIVIMILGIALSFLGQIINVGYLADSVWWQTALWGILSGAAANGIRSSNLIFFKSVVDFIIGLILDREPKE
jgi:hypothetical protein